MKDNLNATKLEYNPLLTNVFKHDMVSPVFSFAKGIKRDDQRQVILLLEVYYLFLSALHFRVLLSRLSKSSRLPLPQRVLPFIKSFQKVS